MLIRLTPKQHVASMGSMMKMNETKWTSKCAVCGAKKAGHTDYCRTHKFAIRRSARRVREEGLLVEHVGGGWWVFDAKGNTLVIGRDSKAQALAALDLGDEEE